MSRQTYTCCKLGLCRDTERNLVSIPHVVDFPDGAIPDSDIRELTFEQFESYQETEESVQPLHAKTFPQFSQYTIEALYRFECSLKTASDSERLAYELELAGSEQN